MAYDPTLGYDPMAPMQDQALGQGMATQGTTLPAPPDGSAENPYPGGPDSMCSPGYRFIHGVGCAKDLPDPCPPGMYRYGQYCYPESGYGGEWGTGDPTPTYGGNPPPFDIHAPGEYPHGYPGQDPSLGPPGQEIDPYQKKCYDPKTGREIPCQGETMPPPPIDCAPGSTWSPEHNQCMPDNIAGPEDKLCMDPVRKQLVPCDTLGTPGGKDDCPPGTYYVPGMNRCMPDDALGGPDNPYPIDPSNPPCPYGTVRNPDGQCVSPDLGTGGPGGGWDVPTLPPPSDYSNLPGSPDPTIPEDVYGISPVDPEAQPLDYGVIQPFIDAAYEEALRTIEPQEQYEDERFVQELINKGVDPYSPAGQKAYDQYKRAQTDRRNAARFQAMQFGRDTQEQMFGQALSKSDLVNRLLPTVMDLRQRGHEFDIGALFKGDEINWKQLMDVTDLNYQAYQSAIDQERYWDAIALLLAGAGPAPGYQTYSGIGDVGRFNFGT